MDGRAGGATLDTMFRHGVIAVGFLFVAGCGGTTIDSSGTGSGSRIGKTAPSGSGGATVKAMPSGSGGAAVKAMPPAAGNSGDDPAQGGSGTAASDLCLHAGFGPTMPEVFSKLNHEEQVCDGPGSDCVDFFEFRADCGLMFQSNNEPQNATATEADCAALARFATSQFLFDGLNDPNSCPPPPDRNPPVMTEIELTSGPGPRKKMDICLEEPFTTLRACVHAFVIKYFSLTK